LSRACTKTMRPRMCTGVRLEARKFESVSKFFEFPALPMHAVARPPAHSLEGVARVALIGLPSRHVFRRQMWFCVGCAGRTAVAQPVIRCSGERVGSCGCGQRKVWGAGNSVACAPPCLSHAAQVAAHGRRCRNCCCFCCCFCKRCLAFLDGDAVATRSLPLSADDPQLWATTFLSATTCAAVDAVDASECL